MKTYSLKTIGLEHTLPIPLNGENRYIKFVKAEPTNPLAFFDTSDTELQEAIENSQFSKSGEIKCIFSNEDKVEVKSTTKSENSNPSGKAKKTEIEPAEFADVTTFKEAKDILIGEPYNVGKTNKSLSSPEGILKLASSLNISFPELKVEE